MSSAQTVAVIGLGMIGGSVARGLAGARRQCHWVRQGPRFNRTRLSPKA